MMQQAKGNGQFYLREFRRCNKQRARAMVNTDKINQVVAHIKQQLERIATTGDTFGVTIHVGTDEHGTLVDCVVTGGPLTGKVASKLIETA